MNSTLKISFLSTNGIFFFLAVSNEATAKWSGCSLLVVHRPTIYVLSH
jgi:hypothetical protein